MKVELHYDSFIGFLNDIKRKLQKEREFVFDGNVIEV